MQTLELVVAEPGLNDVFAAPPSSSSLRAKKRMQRRMQVGALEQEIRRSLDFLERRYPEQRICQRPLALGEGEGRQVEFFDRESGELRFQVRFRFQEAEGTEDSSSVPEVVAESEGVGLLPRQEQVRLVSRAGGEGVMEVLCRGARYVQVESACRGVLGRARVLAGR